MGEEGYITLSTALMYAYIYSACLVCRDIKYGAYL